MVRGCLSGTAWHGNLPTLCLPWIFFILVWLLMAGSFAIQQTRHFWNAPASRRFFFCFNSKSVVGSVFFKLVRLSYVVVVIVPQQRPCCCVLAMILRDMRWDDDPHRHEPASVKKLLKGDASWNTIKTILGWIIDTIAMTITLPPHRLERISARTPLGYSRQHQTHSTPGHRAELASLLGPLQYITRSPPTPRTSY